LKSFKEKPPSTLRDYIRFQRQSVLEREKYWRVQADRLDWIDAFKTVVSDDFRMPRVEWYSEGRLNACQNALDRHLGDQVAKRSAIEFLDDDGKFTTLSYSELHARVLRLSGALVSRGMEAGMRIVLYLPNIPDAVVFMLAAARLGLTYVPVPARYPEDLVARIVTQCGASLVAVGGSSGRADYDQRVVELSGKLDGPILVSLGQSNPPGAVTYAELLKGAGKEQDRTVAVGSEHPLCILYAGSTTGIPRGSVMATAGFMVQAATTHEILFEKTAESTEPKMQSLCHYCAVDMASAAGQSHGVWGPLLAGDTLVLAATRRLSQARRLDRLLGKFPKLTVLTTPDRLAEWTADVEKRPLKTKNRFEIVASCGGVLTPRLYTAAGHSLARGQEKVINLWIQSESGATLICTRAHAGLNRGGALGVPVPGVDPLVYTDAGDECSPNFGGHLAFRASWPAMLRGVWGQPERYKEMYFVKIPKAFTTPDAVRRDSEGFFWFMSRREDIVKIRGLSLCTSEVEAVLQAHPKVGEAAVVGVSSPEGEMLAAFIVLAASEEKVGRETIEEELAEAVEKRIGDFAVPRRIYFAGELPRTSTGKTARRLLRRVASGQLSGDEDLGHIANPQALDGFFSPDVG